MGVGEGVRSEVIFNSILTNKWQSLFSANLIYILRAALNTAIWFDLSHFLIGQNNRVLALIEYQHNCRLFRSFPMKQKKAQALMFLNVVVLSIVFIQAPTFLSWILRSNLTMFVFYYQIHWWGQCLSSNRDIRSILRWESKPEMICWWIIQILKNFFGMLIILGSSLYNIHIIRKYSISISNIFLQYFFFSVLSLRLQDCSNPVSVTKKPTK